jgi:hypothetical protein
MEDDAVGEAVDFSAQKSLGPCPKCGGSVFEHGKDYVCEKSVPSGADVQASCDFSFHQTVLQQPISREQFSKLLDSGKTDLLKGFISIRTGKSLRARLVWDVAKDNVSLEFPEPQRPAASKPVKIVKAEKSAKRKSSDAVTKVTNRFFSNHQSASVEFLEELFKVGNSLDEFDETGKSFSEIGTALQTVEQSVLHKFLARDDCPGWLGVWVAKHGRKEQQFAYLFRPDVKEEMDISERIGSRSPEIKRLFWTSRAAVIVETLLDYDDEIYLAWARDLGFDGEMKTPNLEPQDGDDFVPTPRGQIDEWIERVLDPVTDALWEEHVPKEGACSVLQGEMARCIGRLEHEYWKNGMMNMGGGFYDDMVDKVKKTVLSGNSFSPLVKKVVGIDASVVKGANYAQLINMTVFQHSNVEISLSRLKNVVAAWCLRNIEPIPYKPKPWDR